MNTRFLNEVADRMDTAWRAVAGSHPEVAKSLATSAQQLRGQVEVAEASRTMTPDTSCVDSRRRSVARLEQFDEAWAKRARGLIGRHLTGRTDPEGIVEDMARAMAQLCTADDNWRAAAHKAYMVVLKPAGGAASERRA